MVGTRGLGVPDHVVAGRLPRFEGDVAPGAGAEGEDRAHRVAHVPRHDVEQPVCAERLGDRDGVQSAERPELVPVEVVGPHEVAAGGDELDARVVPPHERGRPVGALVPVDAPALGPGRGVEGDDERLLVVVVDDEQAVAVERRRGGRTPAQARLRRFEPPFPDHRAGHVEREDADVAEVGVDPLSVRHRGRRGEAVLQVPVEPRRAGVDLRGPDDRAGLDVQGVDQPVVRVPFPLHQVPRPGVGEPAVGHRLGRPVRKVEPHARLLGLSVADDGGQEDAIAPHDRRRPAQPVDRGLPHHVLGGAPGEGQARIVVGRRQRVGPAERRPVLVSGREGGRRRPRREQRRREGAAGEPGRPGMQRWAS